MSLKIPKKLKKWSKIATVSLSWWWPWTFKYRYDIWVKQLEENFWVKVVNMKNTLKSPDFVYNNPKKRAEDLMNAFLDDSIDWIISTIWWDNSIRILPYIDFDIIKNNPKVFLWYSDTTITHFICYRAWIRSYYWPSIMAWFWENSWIFNYIKESVEKTLFTDDVIWEIKPNTDWWTDEILDWWNEENQKIKRKLKNNNWWKWLQWKGYFDWELIWWCIDVFHFMWWTKIWLSKDEWKWKILFLETSEEEISETNFERIIRSLWVQWVLQNINWVIMWRALNEKNYDDVLLKVVNWEFWLTNLPIVTNMDFWHTDPMFVIPLWSKAIIDCDNKKFFINDKWAI